MSSIQQALNQTLYQASIAKGFYAQTPAGKEKAELAKLDKQDQMVQSRLNLSDARISPTSTETEDKLYTDDFKDQVEIAHSRFKINPTEQNYKEYTDLKESYEGWEEVLKERKEQREQAKMEQKKALEMRKKLLEGTAGDPNIVPMRKKKVEVDKNGN